MPLELNQLDNCTSPHDQWDTEYILRLYHVSAYHTARLQGVIGWGCYFILCQDIYGYHPLHPHITAVRWRFVRVTLLLLSRHCGFIFQQDNAWLYTVQQQLFLWFVRSCCRTLLWPTRSLDLSPIDHLASGHLSPVLDPFDLTEHL